MLKRSVGVVAAAVVLAMGVASAATYSIPEDQLDTQKVYYGTASGFEKPAEVQYQEIIKATPEFQELKRRNIERGTGRYWILISQASDRAVRTIAQVGQETDFDLIAAEGYLGSIEPAIPAEDVTELVLKAMKSNEKK